MAHRVVVEVEPGEQRVEAFERLVQRLGTKYGAVGQFVVGRLVDAAHGAVQEQRRREADPQAVREQVPGERTAGGQQ